MAKSKTQNLKLKTFFPLIIISLLLSSAAWAVVTPVRSVLNPATETLYVPDNSAPYGIRIYRSSANHWTEVSEERIALPAQSFGLAVWQQGRAGRLLVSINNGAESKLRYYRLNANGYPEGQPTDINITAADAAPRGVTILSDGSMAYLADAGSGRIYRYQYDRRNDRYRQAAIIYTDYNVFDLAVTQPQGDAGNHFIFASYKNATGKIRVYKNESGSVSLVETVTTALSYPTYLKVNNDGDKLYVSLNGASGGDIKVYDVSATGSLSGAKIISSLTGAYGWTGFDTSAHDNYLFFSQEQAGPTAQTKIYRVGLPLARDLTVDDSNLVATINNNVDGIVVDRNYTKLAATYSGTGALLDDGVGISGIPTGPPGTVGNTRPNVVAGTLRQIGVVSNTEITQGTFTNENRIHVRFTVSDREGRLLVPKIGYGRAGNNYPNALEGSPLANNSETTFTIPDDTTFTDGPYEWRAAVVDDLGVQSDWVEMGGDHGRNFPDFIVDTQGPVTAITGPSSDSTFIGDSFYLYANITDNTSNITAAEYFIVPAASTPGAPGTGRPMTASDDSFDGGSELVNARPDLSGLRDGPHTIYVRGQDAAGNWGAFASINIIVDRNSPPSSFSLLTPLDGTTFAVANEITLTWQNNGDVEDDSVHYIISVAGPTPSSATTSTPTHTIAAGSLAPGDYRWYVTAADEPGEATRSSNTLNFRVVTELDTTPPAAVTDFVAVDGADSVVPLSWTNPPDSDLDEILVVAMWNTPPTIWPEINDDGSVTGGSEVYRDLTPDVGSRNNINITDYSSGNPIQNNQGYTFAVFSKDTSGNWNTVVDHDVPDVNADSAIPRLPDNISPAAIDDLQAETGLNSGQVFVRYTTVGDDNDSGTAAAYIIKYSYAGPITNDAEFAAATDYASPWRPSRPGGVEELRPMNGLIPGAQVWISLKAVDEVGNRSPLGNWATTLVRAAGSAPVISRIYPSRAPQAEPTNIVIEGENLAAVISGYVDSVPAEALTDLRVVSAAALSAVVVDGIAPGTYHVRLAGPGGLSTAIEADQFTVMGGADTITAQATDVNITDDNGQATIGWTNPTDDDLAEIRVVRTGPFADDSVDHYPRSPEDGTVIYPAAGAEIPAPGATITVVDDGLTNDQYYFYVVYVRDTSGNWSAVDYTAPDVNAGIGRPREEEIAYTVTSPSIVRNGNAAGDSVIISWQTDPTPHQPVRIYYNSSLAADWTEIPDPAIIPAGDRDTDRDTYTDPSQVGQGTQKYYKVIPTGRDLMDSDLTSDVVGKFDLEVGPSDVNPERAFISLPLEQASYALTDVFGSQPNDYDSISIIDNAYGLVTGMMYEDGAWIEIPLTPRLDTLVQGQGYLYTTLSARHLTIVGKVREMANIRTLTTGLTGDAQFNLEWIGNAFPTAVSVSAAGIENLSSGPDALNAATVTHLDGNGSIIGATAGYAEHRAASNWVDSAENPAALRLLPGKAYMLTDPLQETSTWQQVRP